MVLRERMASDFERCLAMARAVRAMDNYPPRGTIDVAWFLAPPEHLAAWVVEDESSIAGHVALHSATDYVTTRLASGHLGRQQSALGLVARLFVDPARRGSGVGRALLAQATASAVQRGLHPVLDVATHLVGAVALYESAGWERVGEVVLDAWDGRPIDPPLPMYVYVGRPSWGPPSESQT
ncbi:MAG: GNAT family N-acetyltransferase [Acidimicrobiia bacterium]|nr:GNAT family N-acetyltransferase [Acidimicrobiia bacterium]